MGGALKECGCGIKEGRRGLRASVSDSVHIVVVNLSSTPPSSRCWERNEVKAIWWIIRTPILMTILVRPAPPSPGCPQGFPILGSEGSTLYLPGRDGAGSASLSPHRLISSSLSAFLAFSCPS